MNQSNALKKFIERRRGEMESQAETPEQKYMAKHINPMVVNDQEIPPEFKEIPETKQAPEKEDLSSLPYEEKMRLIMLGQDARRASSPSPEEEYNQFTERATGDLTHMKELHDIGVDERITRPVLLKMLDKSTEMENRKRNTPQSIWQAKPQPHKREMI